MILPGPSEDHRVGDGPPARVAIDTMTTSGQRPEIIVSLEGRW
jgi:hypothetical protein